MLSCGSSAGVRAGDFAPQSAADCCGVLALCHAMARDCPFDCYRYVICTQHDMFFLPHINVPGNRISWLVAMCGLLAEPDDGAQASTGKGVRVGPRSLRSSMVLRMVLGRITSDRAPDEVLMRHLGTWVQNAMAAAMVHYFSSCGAAATLAGMVRHLFWKGVEDMAWCSVRKAQVQ